MTTYNILTLFPQVRFVWIWTILISLSCTAPVNAFTITSVSAPNLTRPIDGVVYPFNIQVNGTYDALDPIAPATITVNVYYWDDEFVDDEIDLGGILTIPGRPGLVAVPPAPPTPWRAPIGLSTPLRVGCQDVDLITGVEVFGPGPNGADGTDENPMTQGYFHFRTGTGLNRVDYGKFGYNTVTCVAATVPPTPVLVAPPPYPPMAPVPEPSSIGLVGMGFFGLIAARRRHHR